MMNGRTEVNASLNPCAAAMDRHTWGWSWLCVSSYGRRLVYLRVGRLTIDVYIGGGKTFTAMGGGANGSARYWMWFWPLGKIQWITHKANKGV